MADTPKKEHTLADAWLVGKKIGIALAMTLAISHSFYASYLKEEDVAKGNYQVQKKALEGFSENVDVTIGRMQGQIDILMRVCLPAAAPLAVRSAPAPSEVDSFEDPDADILDEIFELEVASAPMTVAEMPLPQESLKVQLPDAPWEQKGNL